MGKLRGGSTSGGSQIITIDILNDYISQINFQNNKNLFKKNETEVISDFSRLNEIIKDNTKNGFYQAMNAINTNGMGSSGVILNGSNVNSRFQMYATSNSQSSDLWFRTGLNDSLLQWERIATKKMLDEKPSVLKYSSEVLSTAWSKIKDNVYEASINHQLNTLNIISVSLVEYNGTSSNVSFKTDGENFIKIYSTEAISVNLVIYAAIRV